MSTQPHNIKLLEEARNPRTSPERLVELCNNKSLWQTVASNPGINASALDKVAPEFPLEILSNPAFNEVKNEQERLAGLSLVTKLSILLASPPGQEVFTWSDIRETLLQALGTTSYLRIQKAERWSSALSFCIKPGSLGDFPTSEVNGRMLICSEEYGEIIAPLQHTEWVIKSMHDLQNEIRCVLEWEESPSPSEIYDLLEFPRFVESLLSALSGAKVEALEDAGWINGECGSLVDEISIDHTSQETCKCELEARSTESIIDNRTVNIDGVEIELRLEDEKIVGRWLTTEGVREAYLEASRETGGVQSSAPALTIVEGLGELNALWGWEPRVLNSDIPKNWYRYIVQGIVDTASLGLLG